MIKISFSDEWEKNVVPVVFFLCFKSPCVRKELPVNGSPL